MDSYIILVILITLAAGFAYLNHRFIKMPFVIGLFFLSTILSVLIVLSKSLDIAYYDQMKKIIEQTDLSKIILEIMLGFLLFAGSLHTPWVGIKSQLKPILLFSIVGVIVSTAITAGLLFLMGAVLNVEIKFIYCLIFGAIISPTDPIAVIGILTKANVSKKIESTIVGESLFNDGIGVVLFVALLQVVNNGNLDNAFPKFLILFFQEAVGGALFGLILGFLLHSILKSIDDYETEILLTIAFVMSGYSLCSYFNISGALAMVIMGLFVGNFRPQKAMSNTTLQYVLKFWGLLDVVLNAILFVAIAFVIVILEFQWVYLLIGLSAIVIVLMARAIIVYSLCLTMPKTTNITFAEARLVVWGGLRGGLSIALVLSLPFGEDKPVLMIATYACVVFSILVQGLTIEKMARRVTIKAQSLK